MLEMLEKIICDSKEFKLLDKELKDGKMAKTIMLLSKDSDYAFEFAKYLSCLILDEGLKDEKLERSENYFKVKAASHPDVKIYPTKDKLLVADSEEIVDEESVKPIFSERKVFIIRNIEQSMEAAQNKLLKTLEEPQSNVYFILTSANINLVLPTIKSRCNKIELGKLNDKEIESCVGFCDDLGLVIPLSEGFIGKADKLSKMEDLKGLFTAVINVVTKLKTSKELLSYSKALSEYFSEIELILSTLSLIFEDLLFFKAGKRVRLDVVKDQLSSVSGDYTVKAIIEIRKLIDNAVKEIGYNCNLTLVVENLLLNILEVKYLCK